MTFQFIDLILFPAVIQGFVMAFLLWRIPSHRPYIHRSLVSFMVLASFLILGRVMVIQWVATPTAYFWMLTDTALFLLGPLLYQLSRRLSSHQNYILKWPHLLPFFIHLVVLAFLTTVGRPLFEAARANGTVWYFLAATEGAGLLLNLGYWGASLKGLRILHRRNRELTIRKLPNQNIPRYVATLLGGALLAWCFSFVACWGFSSSSYYVSSNILWLCLAAFIYIMGIYYLMMVYLLFRQKIYHALYGSFNHQNKPIHQLPSAKERLKPTKRDQLVSRLHQLMAEQELFRQGDLTQKALANALDTSVQNLSWIFNQHFEKTFFEYINQWRLEAFMTRVNAGEHRQKTLLAIALESGFNSKSTFNRVFKEHYHCTPSQYIAQQAA
ncbi:MAG TPA: hypothetical protein DCE41_04845 [Cytophagales bacterium]|nr:hypothetical protein [Cytophagales bacterium]HAA18703.1 hypothetical protein [Cytophagales bacterium]HAP58325.1 hypothetical protein [Cytophagales bacterium]